MHRKGPFGGEIEEHLSEPRTEPEVSNFCQLDLLWTNI